MPVEDTIKNPYVSLLTFVMNEPEDSGFAMKMNIRYQREIPQSKYAGQVFDYLYDKYFTLPIGSQAPDVALPDRNGNIIKLSDFRGYLVLLDFWASWCQPCRMENQEIIKPLYRKYAGKKFMVFSVSMDADKNKWIKAIEKDKIKFTQLIDPKGFDAKTAILFGVDELPSKYLFSPEGKLIAKNPTEEEILKLIKE